MWGELTQSQTFVTTITALFPTSEDLTTTCEFLIGSNCPAKHIFLDL